VESTIAALLNAGPTIPACTTVTITTNASPVLSLPRRPHLNLQLLQVRLRVLLVPPHLPRLGPRVRRLRQQAQPRRAPPRHLRHQLALLLIPLQVSITLLKLRENCTLAPQRITVRSRIRHTSLSSRTLLISVKSLPQTP